MRKKVFAALLAVCMVVAMLPVSAFATEAATPAATGLKVVEMAQSNLDENTWLAKDLAAAKKLADVKASVVGDTVKVTGKAYYTHHYNFNVSDPAEQYGYIVPLTFSWDDTAYDFFFTTNNGEFYLAADENNTWDEGTEKTYRKLKKADGVIARRMDDNTDTFEILMVAKADGVTQTEGSSTQPNAIKLKKGTGDTATNLNTEIYTVEFSGVECLDTVIDESSKMILDEDTDWETFTSNTKVAFSEQEKTWTDTVADDKGTISTYPAIAFAYTRNVLWGENYKNTNDGFGFQIRKGVNEWVIPSSQAAAEDGKMNYAIISMVEPYTIPAETGHTTGLGLKKADLAGEYTITPVFLGAENKVTKQAGDTITVKYTADAEPVATVTAPAGITMNTTNKTVKAAGEITYDAAEGGYFLNLTIADDKNDNTRAMKSVTLKGTGLEGAAATKEFKDGVAKISFDVTDEALKKAAPTDPDPKAGIKMEIAYGYHDEADRTDVELYNDVVIYTLDITGITTKVTTEADTESTVTVPVTDKTATVAAKALENQIEQDRLNKINTNPGIDDNTIVTVSKVTLNANTAETVSLDAATLTVLNNEEYKVQNVEVQAKAATIGLPAEVFTNEAGEGYRDEAGKLSLVVKDNSNDTEKGKVAEAIEGLEASDIGTLIDVSIPTAGEAGVSGLKKPITITIKVTGAENYDIVFVNGDKLEPLNAKPNEAMTELTAEVTHLSPYAVVTKAKLDALDPSRAFSVENNTITKGKTNAIGMQLDTTVKGVQKDDLIVFQMYNADGYACISTAIAAGDNSKVAGMYTLSGELARVEVYIFRDGARQAAIRPTIK